jgi:SAM-dependent methyltransferase
LHTDRTDLTEVTPPVYDAAFFESHKRRRGYAVLARFLHDVFAPRSAVDFGCGIGETLAHLRDRGCEICGIDSAPAARDASRIPILTANLTQPFFLGRTFDLAISTEVGEHLPEDKAATFVASIAAHTGNALFFTAAQPGQPGVNHINCQPKAYWAGKFSNHGLRRARGLEVLAAVALYPMIRDAWWIRRNVLIFVRKGACPHAALLLFPRYLLRAIRWRIAARDRLAAARSNLPASSGDWSLGTLIHQFFHMRHR